MRIQISDNLKKTMVIVFPIPLPFTTSASGDNSSDSDDDNPAYYDNAPKNWSEWLETVNEGEEEVMTNEQREAWMKHLQEGGPGAMKNICNTALARYPWLYKAKRGHFFEPEADEELTVDTSSDDEENSTDVNDIHEGYSIATSSKSSKQKQSDEEFLPLKMQPNDKDENQVAEPGTKNENNNTEISSSNSSEYEANDKSSVDKDLSELEQTNDDGDGDEEINMASSQINNVEEGGILCGIDKGSSQPIILQPIDADETEENVEEVDLPNNDKESGEDSDLEIIQEIENVLL